ncbi:DUF1800 domain-containing protein [Vallicoccus soli]|uniref:DUF1800 domain-containing protein n=1 Tax=Vallicoccus soli TaxID=2339232 RepID=UPI001C498D9C|nr:DUF1800 domain-containing protein [Vallicoccus soli]
MSPATSTTRRRWVPRLRTAPAATAPATGAPAPAAPAQVATTSPAPGAAWTVADPLLHLLRRATYGPTPASVAAARALGAGAWLEQQLAPGSIPDPVCDEVVGRLEGLRWEIWEVRDRLSSFGSWTMMGRLTTAAVARAVWSERQLLEVMVDFWGNHLNATCPSSEVWDNRAHYDETVLRRHALGTFSDMLVAATTHPAMLRYLDGASSTDRAPNENLGRELLELHTVGIGAGYTEADVRTSALILTGLSVNSDSGEYQYKPWNHWVGPVSILGFSHANATEVGGHDVAVAYLRHLAAHPSTARHLAHKLCVRFVADEPPAALVDRLAALYLAEGTAIVPVLRALFTSPEFAASVGAKTKRPYEDLVSTLRVLQVRPEATGTKGMDAFGWQAEGLGQRPLAWPAPNGYPDVAAAWQSPAMTLGRWNMHRAHVDAWWSKELTRPTPRQLLPATLPATYGELVDAMCLRLVQRTVAAPQRAALLAFLGKTASTAVKPTDGAVQWNLGELAALILDSPYFQVR